MIEQPRTKEREVHGQDIRDWPGEEPAPRQVHSRQYAEERTSESDDEKCKEDDAESVDETAYALSILFRSTHLTVSRFFSWIAASAGGAAGSVIYPGWGAVLGNQIGDSLVGALLD